MVLVNYSGLSSDVSFIEYYTHVSGRNLKCLIVGYKCAGWFVFSTSDWWCSQKIQPWHGIWLYGSLRPTYKKVHFFVLKQFDSYVYV